MSAALWVGGWPIAADGGVLVSGLAPPPSDVPDLPLVPTIGELFDSGAFLNAVVTSNGGVTTVVFEYGTTTAYGTTAPASQSPLAGTAIAEFVSALIGGLTADTTYHWRVSATNSAGTTTSSDQSFTTLPAGTIFFDPLFNSLVPTTAGNPTPTFTRASTAYVSAVAPTGNANDGEVLILCAAGEARFQGARRISANNWSRTYANGKVIPPANLLGFVMEYAGTNVCPFSQDYTQGAWNKDGFTLAANSQIAPDGTLTASTLTETVATANHNLRAGTTNVRCLSVYLKPGTITWVQVMSTDGTAWANFNLVLGTIGFKNTGVIAAIVAVGGGWYRCSVANQTTFSGASVNGLPSDLNSWFPSYAGTGKTFYLWGMQSESVNVFAPSSYIPTPTAGSVTRNEDTLDYATAGNIGATTGTVYAETSRINTPRSGILIGIVRWDQLNFLMMYESTSKLRITTNNGGSVVNTVNSFTINTLNKNASAYSGTTASICLDGGTVGTGGFINGLPASASFRVGGGDTTLFNLNSPIRNIRIYNARITDANLIPLTAIAPTVVTGAATSVTATGATLNGTVTSNGLPTTVDFQYSKGNLNYNKTVTAAQSPLTGSASGSAVSVALTGLQTGTLYHYRVVGTNSSGATYGADGTFTPVAAPTDPFFSSVQLLLHGDGANNGTVFTDSSSLALVPTVTGPIVTATDAQAFGGSSIRSLSGTTANTLVYSGRTFAADNEAFTFECWVRINDQPSVGAGCGSRKGEVFGMFTGATLITSFNSMCNSAASFMFAVPAQLARSWSTVAGLSTAFDRVFIMICRKADNTFTIYVNGRVFVFSGSMNGAIDTISIGNPALGVSTGIFIEEVRFTKGIERFSRGSLAEGDVAFTPPTAAFPNS